MKNKSWRVFAQLILFVSAIYYGVVYRGDRGDLQNPDLLRLVYKPLTSFRGWFSDWKFKLRGSRDIQNKIVVVAIDSDSIAKFGRWPWHRDLLAQVIEEVAKWGPQVIAYNSILQETEHRLPESLRLELKKKNLSSLADKYETDQVFAKTIERLRDRIVLGAVSQQTCQPQQSYLPTGGSCPVHDSTFESLLADKDSTNGIEVFDKPANFELEASPLFISSRPLINFSAVQKNIKNLSLFDTSPDPDGVLRNTILVKYGNREPLPSYALETARLAQNEGLSLSYGGSNSLDHLWFSKSHRVLHVSPVGRMEINYRGSASALPHLAVIDLMNGEQTVPVYQEISTGMPLNCKSCKPLGRLRGKSFPGYLIDKKELLQDSIAFIGLTDLGMELQPIPNYGSIYGVEVNAQITDNLLTGDFIRNEANGKYPYLVLFLLTFGALAFGFTMEYLPSVPAILVFFISGFLFALFDVKYLFANNINLNTGFVYVEYFAIGFLVLLNRYISEEHQRKFLKQAFTRFVSPDVVKTIIDDPNKLSLGGERRELTMMFSDIRGFMPFSARLAPQALHKFLTEYHDAMTQILIEYGTLDKYIGDSIMAFWGAPLPQKNHALNACRAALKMIRELKKINVQFEEKYKERISIGIGINSGPAIVGNMGSRAVFSYTIIGDEVNLASRIERLTRTYGVNILATQAVIDAIVAAGSTPPEYRLLDNVQVLGAGSAVKIVQIMDEDFPKEALDAYAEGLSLHFEKKWDEAIARFRKANELISALGHTDHPSIRMMERCERYKIDPPPENWDGAFRMTRK